MKRINTPVTSEQAVSVVVGALLIVSIMMIAAVQYQNNVIPAQERQADYQHNREVRSQLHHLRSNIVATSSSGQIRTTPVDVGVSYEQQFIFGFLPAVQSPDSAGTLETYNVTRQRGQKIRITGADGRGGASNFWQATNTYNYSTTFLNYTINYARFHSPPKTYYENSVMYDVIPQNGTDVNYAVQSKQNLVQGKNINIITVTGNVSATTTRTVNVQTRPVSAPAQTIVVYSPPPSQGGPLNITIPTNLPRTAWCDLPQCGGGDGAGLLNEQMRTPTNPNGYIADFTYHGNSFSLEFVADETFTLKLSRVHLQTQQDQSPTPTMNASYVAWKGSERITFRENTRHTISAQVRDRYNNPVPGVDTVATAFEANDEDDCVGDFVSGQLGGIAGCPNEKQPGVRTSGDEGMVTYFYDTPPVSDDTQINLNIELAKNSPYANTTKLSKPNFALSSPDTYASPQTEYESPNDIEHTGDTLTVTVNKSNTTNQNTSKSFTPYAPQPVQ